MASKQIANLTAGTPISTDVIPKQIADASIEAEKVTFASLPISDATQTALNLKQDLLVSGTNIKTINSNSLVGAGNVNVVPYKIYAAEITQSGTSSPSSQVIFNQLSGAISWARTSTGIYTGTLAFSFQAGKTYGLSSSLIDTTNQIRLYRTDPSSFVIEQRDFTGTLVDTISIYLEIKVYY